MPISDSYKKQPLILTMLLSILIITASCGKTSEMTSSINREFTVPETSSRLIVKTKPGISSNISSSLASIASTSGQFYISGLQSI